MTSAMESAVHRRRIVIQGIVQGVGFRPFVYGQALRWGLAGFVQNDSNGVTIEVEGTPETLDGFQRTLREQTPPLARIDAVAIELIAPCHEKSFTIAQSQAGTERRTLISPDTATCDDCLHELFDNISSSPATPLVRGLAFGSAGLIGPRDRRYRYPFINCTNCGPRFTIVQDIPYDRNKTTMRVFPLCPACQAEYDDPLNRRFHAQPNACPTCGPHVRLLDAANQPVESADPITTAAEWLARGAILAIKGLGGYHLACDALNVEAVQRLRQRKHREAKPFALMVADLEAARQLCQVSAAEAELLQSRRRPVVLLSQRPGCSVAPAVAPAYDTLGIMLPYTPLHHLLLDTFAAAVKWGEREHEGLDNRPRPVIKAEAVHRALEHPAGCYHAPHVVEGSQQSDARRAGRLAVLVMTSGNLSEEPIAYQDDDARHRLAPIADGMLMHNRDIHMRCDDSVTRSAAGGEQFFRRSRGYAPEPITLALDCPMPLLACGGHLKNTFCLGKGRQAFVSHHIGDLENLETLNSFREGIEHFQRLFDIYQEAVAYDLHPEYLATKYALDADIPQKIGVQHHHAHIASVLAEHGLQEPVIGVAADGTGYGTDGAVWGCEMMVADLLGFERLAHLRYVPLPGGEQAVRQPWRMAATYLAQAYGDAFLELDIPFVRQVDRAKWRILSQMMARQINSPATSSLGRLFDAVAALVGLRGEVLYEGQAAIELEMIGRVDALTPSPQRMSRQIDDPDADIYPFASIGGRPISPAEPKASPRTSGVAGLDEMLTPAMLDVAPMIRAIVSDIQQGVPTARIARRFHRSIAELLAQACFAIREQSALNVVALSGGVFQNRLLLEQLVVRLQEMMFQVYINRRVPPNDGGVSLGQAAIAAARLQRMSEQPSLTI